MKKIIFCAVLLLSGCATMNNGTTQSVRVEPDKPGVNTECNLKNEEGDWAVPANESVKIHRDGNPMEVSCKNDKQVGVTSVIPKFNSEYLVMDIILIDACIISCIVDGVNNAFYEYPNTISVPMRDK